MGVSVMPELPINMLGIIGAMVQQLGGRLGLIIAAYAAFRVVIWGMGWTKYIDGSHAKAVKRERTQREKWAKRRRQIYSATVDQWSDNKSWERARRRSDRQGADRGWEE